ncbi:MAG: hypothetical protein L6R35_006027, partial [Caloplaca aegaea]
MDDDSSCEMPGAYPSEIPPNDQDQTPREYPPTFICIAGTSQVTIQYHLSVPEPKSDISQHKLLLEQLGFDHDYCSHLAFNSITQKGWQVWFGYHCMDNEIYRGLKALCANVRRSCRGDSYQDALDGFISEISSVQTKLRAHMYAIEDLAEHMNNAYNAHTGSNREPWRFSHPASGRSK